MTTQSELAELSVEIPNETLLPISSVSRSYGPEVGVERLPMPKHGLHPRSLLERR